MRFDAGLLLFVGREEGLMANNRLYLAAIDDDGNVKKTFYFAKHFGGPWYLVDHVHDKDDPDKAKCEFVDALDGFLRDAFIEGCGIAFMDEDGFDDEEPFTPRRQFPEVWLYNSYLRGKHWELVPDEEEEQ